MEKERTYTKEALEYLAKIADGGLRDAITLMDKCLSFSDELTLENVVKALGTVDYEVMLNLTDAVIGLREKEALSIIEDVHASGKDVKRFLKQYIHFLLDIGKYNIGCDWRYINVPRLPEYENWLSELKEKEFQCVTELLKQLMKLNAQIKYSDTAKLDLEAALLIFIEGRT